MTRCPRTSRPARWRHRDARLHEILGQHAPEHGSPRPALTDEQRRRRPPVPHPVLLTHPITGRKVLYCNPGFTDHIDGMPRAESDALLACLFEFQLRERFRYTHHWTEKDLLIWDNLGTIHRAIADYRPGRNSPDPPLPGDGDEDLRSRSSRIWRGPPDMLTIEPTGAVLGATVRGLDLSRPVSDLDFGHILNGLGAYGVLHCPDMHLDMDDFKAFSLRFGDIQGSPVPGNNAILAGLWRRRHAVQSSGERQIHRRALRRAGLAHRHVVPRHHGVREFAVWHSHSSA